MERVNSLKSNAGEAGRRKKAASVSRLAKWEDLLCLGSGDCLQTLAPGASGGAKKVIAQKVSGSVKWYNVKHGYGFINRHDTKEEVFVHHSAIAQTRPRRYHRGVDAGEAVEFDVVQGKRGPEAANVTGPAGAPVKGSRFSPGFCIRHVKLQPPRDVGDAKEDIGSESFLAAQGQKPRRRRRRPRHPHRPHAQQRQRFPSCRVRAATHHPATFTVPAPAAGPVGTPPRRGHGPSYRLSRPRGRGTAPDPKPSPNLAQELEAEKEESRINAVGLQQGFPPCYTCHCFNKLCDCHCPQQSPGKQGQKPEGGEGDLGKGPAGKPACVAEKTSTSKEEAAVAKASSAARAQ